MAQNSFGLDIGSKKIKLAMLHGDLSHLSLKTCVSADMPSVGMISESSFDLEEIAETIKQLVKEANVTTPYVHSSLPDNVVYSKIIQIPSMANADLNNAIYWEAEQNIPAPLSTITLSWQVLRKRQKDGDEMMDILLVGAPTKTVKKYQSVLEMAGLKPLSLETEMLSVIRSMNIGPSSPVSLVINVTRYNTSIAVVDGGILSFVYSIPIGSTAIIRAVMTQFSLSIEQAEQYIQVYGISNQQIGAKIAGTVQPILQSIIMEVRKALAYYADKYKQASTVNQIILSGAMSKLAGIDIFFVKNLGIETVVSNPWKAHNIDKVPQQIMETDTDYVVAVGLSLLNYAK